jgi:hypothetical protein
MEGDDDSIEGDDDDGDAPFPLFLEDAAASAALDAPEPIFIVLYIIQIYYFTKITKIIK